VDRALDVRRVAVTSVVRNIKPGQVSGYFRIVDLDRGVVSFVTPAPESVWRSSDPNPRGGTRGTRGVSAHGGRLAVVNTERLFVFDTAWRLVSDFTNPLMSDVHDVLAEERGVWVAATGCDTLILIGWDGEIVEAITFRDDQVLLRELGFPERYVRPLDEGLDYRDPHLAAGHYNALHVNSLGSSREGLLMSFGRIVSPRHGPGAKLTSAIVSLADSPSDGRRWSILHQPEGVDDPSHNVAEDGRRLIYSHSTRGCVVVWDRDLRAELTAVTVPGDPAFARGLAHVWENLWLVGSQWPLALHLIDLAREQVIASYELDGVGDECVFAVCPLPDEFADPPPLVGRDPFVFWGSATLAPGVTRIPV
jgi:hypothetical protein